MRQLFDEQAREQAHRRHGRHSSSQAQAVYADAKRSSVDESIFGPSSLTSQSNMPMPIQRNYDFERAKQKFDRPTTSSSSRNPKKARNFSSFLKFNNKRSDPSPVDNECYGNSPRNSQYLDDDALAAHMADVGGDMKRHNHDKRMKNDSYMQSSINLDGFKVSEDDDDVSKTGKSRSSQFV